MTDLQKRYFYMLQASEALINNISSLEGDIMIWGDLPG